MKKIIPLFIILCFALLSAGACSGQKKLSAVSADIPAEAVAAVNLAIEKAPLYAAKKNALLDSLKTVIFNSPRGDIRLESIIKVASIYRQVNTDSAIFYAQMGVNEAAADSPENLRIRSRLSLINALSTAGLFTLATQRLDSLRPMMHDIGVKIEFWKTARMLNSYMFAFATEEGEFADIFRSRYIECDDSLLRHLPPTDPFRRFINAERLVAEGRWDNARKHLQEIVDNHPQESNLYGMASYQLAEVYKHKGDFRNFAKCLALSAESDIKGCVKEGIALPALANWLYEKGDLYNAFNFINFALEEANTGNMRMRTVTIAALMPIIDSAYRKQIDDSRNKMAEYLIISVTLLLIALVLFVVLLRNIRNTRLKERKLAVSSKKLEAYVGNFMGLCANYSSRLDQLAKLVIRKINAKQTDDLLKLVSSGRFTEEDNEEFYQLIDKAILDIFPNFVDNINTLLVPEKRIILKPDESLNPELRIYAFVRLGVDQSAKIAQILHYSVNTVYTYRNRMRNRAVNRDTFDNDIINLEHTKNFFQNSRS